MLALPGSAYLYQGEELGLPEVIDLPDDARQDPTWFRTDGERTAATAAACRSRGPPTAPAYGFSPTGAVVAAAAREWATLARDAQDGGPGSTLSLYRTLLAARRAHALGAGTLEWLAGFGDGRRRIPQRECDGHREPRRRRPIPLPRGNVIAASEPITDGTLPVDTAVWLETARSDRRRGGEGGRRGQHR